MDPHQPDFSISSLSERPDLAPLVADRVWNAWWRQQGVPLSHIQGLVDDALASSGIPIALAAHRGQAFLGTASIIENDLESRPQYTPWVAAVWVEAQLRKQGIGAALVKAATDAAFRSGAKSVYLCAEPANSAFYARLGWLRIETDVDGLDIFRLDPE